MPFSGMLLSMKVFTAQEMRDCDRRTIEEYGVPGVCLMEAAGVELARAVREEIGSIDGKTVTILCGKGNNGGDGFVAARHLLGEGATVRLFLFGGTPADLSGDAATHYKPLSKWKRDGFHLETLPDVAKTAADLAKLEHALRDSSVILDCIYGTGFRPPLPPLLQLVAEIVDASGVPLIACDIPSGVQADTGEDGGVPVFQAKRTVTFAGLKRGLLFFPGATSAGRVTVAPIGIPPVVLDEAASAELITADWVRERIPPRLQSRDANKGQNGNVLVIAGSAGMAGAATLTALSALRAGAGLVHLAIPESVLDTAAVLAPELVLRPMPETEERSHGGEGALKKLLALAEKADVVALGPGIGGNTVTKSFVQTFVRELPAEKPLVIDADGLNAIADAEDDLFAHRSAEYTVLTPHPGEAGRLLGSSAKDVQADRVKAVRDAAKKYRATVLLKGTRTLIATQDDAEPLYINHGGSVALGTAGSGDVLTGVIAGLWSDRENKCSALDAARAGAFLHAIAGALCERKHGAVGTIATEIRDTLPEARASLYDDTKRGILDDE